VRVRDLQDVHLVSRTYQASADVTKSFWPTSIGQGLDCGARRITQLLISYLSTALQNNKPLKQWCQVGSLRNVLIAYSF